MLFCFLFFNGLVNANNLSKRYLTLNHTLSLLDFKHFFKPISNSMEIFIINGNTMQTYVEPNFLFIEQKADLNSKELFERSRKLKRQLIDRELKNERLKSYYIPIKASSKKSSEISHP
jgi:hypothetical protein